MKKETLRAFKERIMKEGYDLFLDCIDEGVKYYHVVTPEGRTFTGTLDEVKEFIGE